MTIANSRQSDSISRFLEARAAAAPAATAILWDDQAISIETLLDDSRRLARGLADLGITRGDRIALWLPNSPAWLALYFACARLGAIAVAVNTRFRSAEIADIVARSGARILVLWPGFRQIDFLGILEAVDRLRSTGWSRSSSRAEMLPKGLAQGKTLSTYEALRQRPPYRDDHGDGPVGSIIFTTSGTTKAPKFVLHDHFSVVSHARAVTRSFGYDIPGAVLLQSLPLCGVFGFCQAMASLAGGAPIVMQPGFDAEEAARLIRRHRVTALNGSEEMVAKLLATSVEAVPFPSLDICCFAAFNPTLDGIMRRRSAVGYGSPASTVQARCRRCSPARIPPRRPRSGAEPGAFPSARLCRPRARSGERHSAAAGRKRRAGAARTEPHGGLFRRQ